MITTRRLTETVREVQSSWVEIGALVASVHRPGPRNGTSATAKAALSEPLSTLFETVVLRAGATLFSLEPVTAEYFFLLGIRAAVTVGVFFWRGVGVVVVVVVGDVGTTMAIVEVVVDGAVSVCVVRGEVLDVNVKTNTTSRRGLDHISRCALRSDESLRAMVIKGYRCWRRRKIH
jgi:hypothetical protein